MKKFISTCMIVLLLLSITMLGASASDASSLVKYSGEFSKTITIEGTDYVINNQTPYVIVVPQTITVNADAQNVYLVGLTLNEVTVSADKSVMLTGEKSGETLEATVAMNDLVLPVTVDAEKTVTSTISAKWVTAPLTDKWQGTINYTVSS